jgi:hypothetical protein
MVSSGLWLWPIMSIYIEKLRKTTENVSWSKHVRCQGQIRDLLSEKQQFKPCIVNVVPSPHLTVNDFCSSYSIVKWPGNQADLCVLQSARNLGRM